MINVLMFNTFWDMAHPDYTQYLSKGLNIFTNQSKMDKADVVVFHAPSLAMSDDELVSMKTNWNQKWVFWSLESEVNYPQFQNPKTRRLFDISATYSLDSDIPMPYIENIDPYNWRRPAVRKDKLMNAFISGDIDKSGRIAYLTNLMSHIKIDSFGTVLNNIQLKEDTGASSKEQVISRYKFTLALENSIAPDYVTEKFFQPLVMGSVPVYLGAPNIGDFAPHPNSYINVNDFSSVRDLAEYIKFLDKNDEEYEKFVSWKREPFSHGFMSLINIERGTMVDRLAKYLYKLPIK